MQREVEIILGSPGTGKTTYQLNKVDEHLAAGIPASRIAYMSFTKKAASEAADRAITKFSMNRNAFEHFRTIHSMAFRQLGITREEVLQRSDYKQLAQMLGIEFSGFMDVTETPTSGSTEGDVTLQLISLAAAMCKPLEEVWRLAETDVGWYTVKLFADTLAQYKKDSGKLDFNDMLELYIERGEPLNVDVGFLDEAQDNSALQWAAARVALRHCKHIYIGGDDDQSIYKWSGADVDTFLSLKGHTTVLPLSHRLPKPVFDIADAITHRIKHRFAKEWAPADHDGSVNWLTDIEQVPIKQGESWMLLARNGYQIKEFEQWLKRDGIPYTTAKGPSIDLEHAAAITTWERLREGKPAEAKDIRVVASLIRGWKYRGDATATIEDLTTDHGLATTDIWHEALTGILLPVREYYLACRRNGYQLHEHPTVYAGTIHSVKGGEADNVALSLDMSYKTHEAYLKSPDDEHRCFYVGVTRARKNLYPIQAQTNRGYLL